MTTKARSDAELASAAIHHERLASKLSPTGTVAAVAYSLNGASPVLWRCYKTADRAEPYAVGFGFPALPGELGDLDHNILRCLATCPNQDVAMGHWRRKLLKLRQSPSVDVYAVATLPTLEHWRR